jgi:hypothetical protein
MDQRTLSQKICLQKETIWKRQPGFLANSAKPATGTDCTGWQTLIWRSSKLKKLYSAFQGKCSAYYPAD